MALRQIFRTQLTDVDSTARDTVGSLRIENDIIYKYVKFTNTTATVAVVAGDPVAYKATYAAGIAVHTVVSDMTDADAQPIHAGNMMGTCAGTLATSFYCWIQISGACVVPTAIAGTPVIGSGVMMSTTDKTLTLVTGVINPTGVSTSTTAANNTVILRCPH